MFYSERNAYTYNSGNGHFISKMLARLKIPWILGSCERVCLLIRPKVDVILPRQERLAKVNGNSRLNMYAKRLGCSVQFVDPTVGVKYTPAI